MEDVKPVMSEEIVSSPVTSPDELDGELCLKTGNKHLFRFTHLGFKKKWHHKMTQFMKREKSAEKVLRKVGVTNG